MRSLYLSVLFVLVGSQLALAEMNPELETEVVPTLGEWGIIPGILGALVLRKRLFPKS